MRGRLALRLAMVLLLGSAPATAAVAGPNAVSRVVVTDEAIIIIVPIEVVGGSDAIVASWRRAIDEVWNKANDGRGFNACGRRIVFDAQFTLNPSPEPFTRPSHVVVIETVAPGQSYVSRVWHALGTSPAYSARTGFWGSNIDGATAAHEFGHLLGLLDEYVENENGLRDPGERPVPDTTRYSDAPMSLMAHEQGSVLQRHVREVLHVHGVELAPGCSR